MNTKPYKFLSEETHLYISITWLPFSSWISAGGCSCSSHIIWYYGLDYGNCKREHGNGNGKFCYVNLPTTCSDAEQSSADPTKKMSWEACQCKFLVLFIGGIHI